MGPAYLAQVVQYWTWFRVCSKVNKYDHVAMKSGHVDMPGFVRGRQKAITSFLDALFLSVVRFSFDYGLETPGFSATLKKSVRGQNDVPTERRPHDVFDKWYAKGSSSRVGC